ncbi:hypothetical protein ACSBR1_043938 (mitochondrion) [Camellia fascicularis]
MDRPYAVNELILMLGLVASKFGNERSLPKALGTCLINHTDSFNSSLKFCASFATPLVARLGLAPFARLSYRLGFVLEATASASLGFAIAHDWYMDLSM